MDGAVVQRVLKAELGHNINIRYRIEKGFKQEIVALVMTAANALSPIVTLRTYGTQNTNYACIWISGEGAWGNGSGKAGGYGYHRESAAAQEAIESAGIYLAHSISGVGQFAMEDAVRVIAEYLTDKTVYIHTAHP